MTAEGATAGDAMVRATVNGQPTELPKGTTVSELVRSVCGSRRGVAVAVGSEVVPRSSWDRTVVEDGSRVEVVTAAAGG